MGIFSTLLLINSCAGAVWLDMRLRTNRWVNNPTLGEFCFTMIGRADIEGSKSNVAMKGLAYPCGNFSDTPCNNSDGQKDR